MRWPARRFGNAAPGDEDRRAGDRRRLRRFVELPGFKKEDVKLDLDNGYLTISARRNEELDDKDNEGRYIRQERATGSCARSFYVGKELEPKDISAKFENGNPDPAFCPKPRPRSSSRSRR